MRNIPLLRGNAFETHPDTLSDTHNSHGHEPVREIPTWRTWWETWRSSHILARGFSQRANWKMWGNLFYKPQINLWDFWESRCFESLNWKADEFFQLCLHRSLWGSILFSLWNALRDSSTSFNDLQRHCECLTARTSDNKRLGKKPATLQVLRAGKQRYF